MLLIYMIDSSNFFFAFYDYYVMFGWLICYIMLECQTKFESLCFLFIWFFFVILCLFYLMTYIDI